MRVALVVFANKYTGAAAVAEHCCRALLARRAEARLVFVAGRNLERRLAEHEWAEAGFVKERSPARLWHNIRSLKRVAAQADVVICHLPHDHALCVAAGVQRSSALVRAFRNPGHLRSDPWHRALARRLSGATLAHGAMTPELSRCYGALPQISLPVPIEDRFHAGVDGSAWRHRLSIPDPARVVGMVGKLVPGRGFDLLLESAARLEGWCHVLAIGHGESHPDLERLAHRLGLADRVHWVGYQEHSLPELYALMDVVIFAAPGSDHGHRAISEAQACGRPVVAGAVRGVEDLVAHGDTGLIVESAPESLAEAVNGLLQSPETARRLGLEAAEAVAVRRFSPVGSRLAEFLEGIVSARGKGMGKAEEIEVRPADHSEA
jgi:glycosyltransferase involved in cell wall biosynthesis